MSDVVKFAADVKQELTELKMLGMEIPDKAFDIVNDLEVMSEYQNMRISECADLIFALANLKD